MPHPDFFQGYTSVPRLTHFDLNGDGWQDLILAHQRNDDGPPGKAFTGRLMQVLVNRGGFEFVDETATWMGDQSETTVEIYNAGHPEMHDIDRNECADLVIARSDTAVSGTPPLAYRNLGNSFEPMPAQPFGGAAGVVPADVNGDGAIDLVHVSAGDIVALVNVTSPPVDDYSPSVGINGPPSSGCRRASGRVERPTAPCSPGLMWQGLRRVAHPPPCPRSAGVGWGRRGTLRAENRPPHSV